MDATTASFDIMSKGLLGSFTVAGIMAILTVIITKILTPNNANK